MTLKQGIEIRGGAYILEQNWVFPHIPWLFSMILETTLLSSSSEFFFRKP